MTDGIAAFPVEAHCQAMNHASTNTAELACLLTKLQILPVLISIVSGPDVHQIIWLII